MQTHKNFFIVGTQRSGTTLLRLILNAHSQLAVPEEAAFLRPLLTDRCCREEVRGEAYKNLVSYFLKSEQYKLWNYDSSSFLTFLQNRDSVSVKELISQLFSSYCLSERKSIWGDKTPIFWRKIGLLSRLFPKAVFIHIVRDGRDVFDSWRKMDPTKDNPAVTALDWCYKLRAIEQGFSKIRKEQKIVIRYEDLIESPEKTVMDLCKKIDVPFEPDMLEFYSKSSYYIGTHHSKLIFKPLNSSNKQKWKKNLKEDELKTYDLIAAGFLKKYGYQVRDRKGSLTAYLLAFTYLLKGLPPKIGQIWLAKRLPEKALASGKEANLKVLGNMPLKRK